MVYSTTLAVTLLLFVHSATSCCLDWFWPEEEKPSNTTTTVDTASKATDWDPPEVLVQLDNVGQALLRFITDPLGMLEPPAPTDQPATAAEGADNKEKPPQAPAG